MRVSPVERRILELSPGAVFSAIDFADVTDPHNASNRLQELAKRGLVEKVLRGIYWKPFSDGGATSPSMAATLEDVATQLAERQASGDLLSNVRPADANAPAIGSVADAIARSRRWTIVPAGRAALDLLRCGGFEDGDVTYLSSGPYATYDLGDRRIVFKHASERSMGGDEPVARLVVQALRELRREGRICRGDSADDEKALGAIVTRLPQYLVNELPEATRTAPAWMRPLVAVMPTLKERQVLWNVERNRRVLAGHADPGDWRAGSWDEFWTPLESPQAAGRASAAYSLDAIARDWRNDFNATEE